MFHSIKPLFANKPLLIVVNKTDVRPIESLSADERKLLEDMESEARRISSGGEMVPKKHVGSSYHKTDNVLFCIGGPVAQSDGGAACASCWPAAPAAATAAEREHV